MADEGFTRRKLDWLDQVLKDEGVTPRAFQAAYAIASHHLSRERGYAWPSLPTLAAEIHASPRRAQQAVSVLIERGHLECKRGGKNHSNRYYLKHDDKTKTSDQTEFRSDETVTSKRAKTGRNRPINDPLTGRFQHFDRTKSSETYGRNRPCNPLNEPSEEPYDSPRNNDGAPDFEEFWRQYPRKVSKQAALKAYRAALKKVSPSTILQGVMRYAASRQGENPKFTKHPDTWLNAGCWDDEPDPPKSIRQGTYDLIREAVADRDDFPLHIDMDDPTWS